MKEGGGAKEKRVGWGRSGGRRRSKSGAAVCKSGENGQMPKWEGKDRRRDVEAGGEARDVCVKG